MNKRYISGANFEYKVKNYFEELDVEVMRSAGSHGIDLAMFFRNKGEIWLVSCKKAGYWPKDELKELNDFKENLKADKICLCYPIKGMIAIKEL